jgi:chemotaxis protein MotB
VAKTVWDDIASDESEDRATNVRKSPSSDMMAGRPQSALLPWLLFGLAGAGAVTLLIKDMAAQQDLHHQVAAARDESGDLRKQLFVAQDKLSTAESARAKTAATAAQLQEKASTNDKLINELKSQLDAKDGDVSADKGSISVNLVDQILFKSGEADISPRGKQVLSKVGGVLKGITDKQILIGGHTDDRPIHTPQFPSNWELSAARAVNVVHYLAETVGVDAARLTAAGYSEFHPRSKRDKAKNRRIEILLTPTVEVAKK